MIGVLFFLSAKGEIIVSRCFRDNQNVRAIADTFRSEVIATKLVDRSPIKTVGNITFFLQRFENLYVVATASSNVNALTIFEYMKNLMNLLKSYFGNVNEEVVRQNFVTIQELIDETADYGYPQLTEVDVLKSFITTTGIKPSVLATAKESEQITIKATGNINWRREGIVYRSNEVFIDIIEEVNLLVSQTGTVLNRDVVGKIVMKSFLSGMPECKFGLNDKMMIEAEDNSTKLRKTPEIDLEDVTFHQCVRLGRFDADRTISFIPPDGEFVLMKFRTSESVQPPFRVLTPVVKELGKTRIEIEFKVKADFASRTMGKNVVITIPTPSNTAVVKANVSIGKSKYEPQNHGIVWRIRKFPGQSEARFSAEIQLISTTNEKTRAWTRPPISFNFQVPMYASSGLNVRFLKVHENKHNYQTTKWVRYMTKAGQYECRI